MQMIPEAKNGAWKRMFSMWAFAILGGLQTALAAAAAYYTSLPTDERMAWIQNPDTLTTWLLIPAMVSAVVAGLGAVGRMIQQDLPDGAGNDA